jgi:hypothetical protein
MPNGYPRVATFLDSDENFMVYRRFGYLQSRIILEKQDNLRQMEDKLDRMDRIDSRLEKREANARLLTRDSFGADFQAERVALLKEIEREWMEYGKSDFYQYGSDTE